MRWARLVPDAIALAALAVVLAAVGAATAMPLTAALATAAGIEILALESERAPLFASISFAAACAVPPILAFLIDLLHRLRASAPPSLATLMLTTLALVLGIPLGLAWQLQRLRMIPMPPAGGSFLGMFTLASIDVDGSALRAVIAIGVLLAIGTVVRTRRRV